MQAFTCLLWLPLPTLGSYSLVISREKNIFLKKKHKKLTDLVY